LKHKLATESQVGEYEDYCEFMREFFDANQQSEDADSDEQELSDSEEEADEKLMERLEEGTSVRYSDWTNPCAEEDAEELSDEDMYSEEE
jgi:hypothetical protein